MKVTDSMSPKLSGSSMGHWRTLKPGQTGKDQSGNSIINKTWVSKGSSPKNFMRLPPKVAPITPLKQEKKPSGITAKSVMNIGLAAITIPSFALGIKLAIRGSRLRGLQKIKPKVTTESIPDFMKKLEPGDVLLVGKDDFKGRQKLMSDLFRKSEGYYVHTAMYMGNGKIVHINPGRNPEIFDLSRYLKSRNGSMIAIRPDATKVQKDKMVEIADKYAKEGKLTYGGPGPRMAIFGDTPIERKAINMMFGEDIVNGKVICSSMVADIQKKVGLKHLKSPRMMTSIDFRSMSNPPTIRYKPPGGPDFKTSRVQGAGFMLPGFLQAGYHYKTASAKILIPPPPKDSIQELSEISKERKGWIPNKKLDDAYDSKIPQLFQKFLANQGISYSSKEILRFAEEIKPVIIHHKNYFDRDRPHEFAQKKRVPFDHDYDKLFSAHTRSYPSGHTTQAFYIAFKLSDEFPEFKADFHRIAKKVALSRIHRGVHYHSDNEAGIQLALALHNKSIEKKASIHPVLAGIVSLKESGVL